MTPETVRRDGRRYGWVNMLGLCDRKYEKYSTFDNRFGLFKLQGFSMNMFVSV